MAAYAALVSFLNTISNIQIHPRLSASLDKDRIESLGDKIDFLLDFIDSYSCSKKTKGLESQIASAANAAEDVIESYIVDLILVPSTRPDHAQSSSNFLLNYQKTIKAMKKKVKNVREKIVAGFRGKSPSLLVDLQKIIEEMESLREKVMKVKEEWGSKDHQSTYSMPAASSRHLSSGKTTMVGFDGYLMQLLERLTAQQSGRQVIPIIGMGGIGKTTLAINVYEHLVIVEHFYIRAWVTVSQQYNVREILLEILSCLRESTSEQDKMTEEQLGEQLYKALSGRRYLIILDDMWCIEAWNKIMLFFPDNYNNSRIIVTTRLSNVAHHFGPSELVVDFLDEVESWNLFCETAFAQQDCPFQLEEVGKMIVKKCKGLPLSIVVIGGLLKKSSRTQEFWKNVARDMSSALNLAEDNRCLNILSLSYNHLPAHLKPCFLYFGIFSEDSVINKAQLIKLLVAEGFIKPNTEQSLEEIAEASIKDLTDRNLIVALPLGVNVKFESFYIHDILRELCLQIAKEENFFMVKRAPDSQRNIDKEHRIILSYAQVFRTFKSESFFCSPVYGRPGLLLYRPRLLRVLNEGYSHSLDATFRHVNLRFLSYNIDTTCTCKLPSSISSLWNLQTLIITGVVIVVAPLQIWEMPQLRHVQVNKICLPDPLPVDKQDDFVLPNLQTLKTVLNFRCSKEVCNRMPNIKKLHIVYDDFSGEGGTDLRYCLYNIGCLNKLESLKYDFDAKPNRVDLLLSLTFPGSLKELFLGGTWLHWEDLTMIGSLPYLEVLKLSLNSVVGPEWSPLEGKFVSLKFLGIYFCFDLTKWNADRSHFPVVENLVLYNLHELIEIPSGIGEIPTLHGIYLSNCSVSAAISAIKILEEQENLGNQSLRVQVKFGLMKYEEEFRQQVELEGFTSHNFQIVSF